MEIKVRDLGSEEAKSTQEIEQELLEKHEQSLNEEIKINEPVEAASVEKTTEKETEEPKQVEKDKSLSDEDVLSYISERYGKTIDSFDELVAERSESPDLPEDVAAYYKYKQETGRGMNDFVRLNSSSEDMNEEDLLLSYYMETEEGLDKSDIEDMIYDKFYMDEDVMEERELKSKRIEKKKELAKAKKHFNAQKEKYKAPLESSAALSDEDKSALEQYREYLSNAGNEKQEVERRAEWFTKKTSEVFNNDFKGFDFSVDDKAYTYSPGAAKDLKKAQSDVYNFIGKYIGDDGLIKDASGYHKALSVAMNPEKFAKFFYEQGRSEAIEGDAKRAKNIKMDVRQTPRVTSDGGFKVRAVDSGRSRGLTIKSINKKT